MTTSSHTAAEIGPRTCAEELAGEVGRYLEAVELYRHLGCEPRWQTEADEQGICGAAAGPSRREPVLLWPILGS
jgi:hypothetical protein